MSHYAFTFQGAALHALATGALFWPAHNLLCVSDLHFGKAQRYAARGGGALPPYETQDTLLRLENDISQTGARTIICLGDSFDSIHASAALDAEARQWITRLQAGRRWVWIEGNHDPGPINLGGAHHAELGIDALIFRHIATPQGAGEISGHYHPKATLPIKGRHMSRRCFICDHARLIMPAYGTYTGGLNVLQDPLASMFDESAICVLIGAQAMPMPRPRSKKTLG